MCEDRHSYAVQAINTPTKKGKERKKEKKNPPKSSGDPLAESPRQGKNGSLFSFDSGAHIHSQCIYHKQTISTELHNFSALRIK